MLIIFLNLAITSNRREYVQNLFLEFKMAINLNPQYAAFGTKEVLDRIETILSSKWDGTLMVTDVLKLKEFLKKLELTPKVIEALNYVNSLEGMRWEYKVLIACAVTAVVTAVVIGVSFYVKGNINLQQAVPQMVTEAASSSSREIPLQPAVESVSAGVDSLTPVREQVASVLARAHINPSQLNRSQLLEASKAVTNLQADLLQLTSLIDQGHVQNVPAISLQQLAHDRNATLTLNACLESVFIIYRTTHGMRA